MVLVVVVVVWVLVVRVALELQVSCWPIALGLDGLDNGEDEEQFRCPGTSPAELVVPWLLQRAPLIWLLLC